MNLKAHKNLLKDSSIANYTGIHKLYEKIKNCRKCQSCGNHLTKPWIGKEYDRKNPKLLFVGINMNNPGPEDTDLTKFIDNHPEFFSKGLYGFMPRLAKQIFSLSENNPRQLYDHFAFTNIIKCSPGSNRSKPTNEMWNECSYIKDEIELLEPDIIVAMGNGCYASLAERFIGEHGELALSKELQKYITKIKLKETKALIVKIDHPSENRAINIAKSKIALILEFIEPEAETHRVLTDINSRLEYFIAGKLIDKVIDKNKN